MDVDEALELVAAPAVELVPAVVDCELDVYGVWRGGKGGKGGLGVGIGCGGIA